MNIAFIYNVRHVKPSLDDKRATMEAEFDTPETISGICLALKNLGHKVFQIEADENAYHKLKRLKNKIDLVFNIAEGLHGEDREGQVPAMLEMLQIPYVGSRPLAQSLCLNKAKAKEILKHRGIPTPSFQVFRTGLEEADKTLRFPLIIKPNSEGSSKGIWQNSVVKDEKELKERVKEIIEKLNQPVIAEELLQGREFTIGLIENNPVEVLAPVEIDYSGLPENYVKIDSYETKWLIDNPDGEVDTVICPANVDEKLWAKMKEVCINAKEALEVLDWCRIDVRLDDEGLPHILEINQIPGIIPDPRENSRFPLSARKANYSYEQMLQKIIDSACKRYNIFI